MIICANPKCGKHTANPKYCGLSCGSSHQGFLKREKLINDYNDNPKPCLQCSKPLPYNNHRGKKFCSHSCSASYNNAERDEKILEKQRQSLLITLSKKPKKPKKVRIKNLRVKKT